MCAAVPVRALLQLPLLGVNRGYKGLYGGGWPLRGMGAAGTALGAADARTNEHYEIGTILTQKSQGVRERPRTSAHVRARRTTRHCPGSLTLRFPHTQIPSRSDSVQGGAEVCHRPGWSEILRGRAWASARGRRQVPEGMGVGATLGLPVALSAQ